ncbi:hypothetical protein LDENG_00126290 [Lucifuga dentata]|nr:hypothetical protein LDENG_00126290 [Lucifuga dentata]
MGYVIPPACSGSTPGSPPSRLCPEILQREVSRRHSNQMPEPPQLAHLNTKEQLLYFEPLPDVCASHLIPKNEHSHPSRKLTVFTISFFWSRPIGVSLLQWQNSIKVPQKMNKA